MMLLESCLSFQGVQVQVKCLWAVMSPLFMHCWGILCLNSSVDYVTLITKLFRSWLSLHWVTLDILPVTGSTGVNVCMCFSYCSLWIFFIVVVVSLSFSVSLSFLSVSIWTILAWNKVERSHIKCRRGRWEEVDPHQMQMWKMGRGGSTGQCKGCTSVSSLKRPLTAFLLRDRAVNRLNVLIKGGGPWSISGSDDGRGDEDR